jgi:hypothetical protein
MTKPLFKTPIGTTEFCAVARPNQWGNYVVRLMLERNQESEEFLQNLKTNLGGLTLQNIEETPTSITVHARSVKPPIVSLSVEDRPDVTYGSKCPSFDKGSKGYMTFSPKVSKDDLTTCLFDLEGFVVTDPVLFQPLKKFNNKNTQKV